MARLTVSIVTPTKRAVKSEADMVVAPSVSGEVGILPNHRPLLADLESGVLIVRSGDKNDRYAISDGFLEVEQDRVTILAETIEHSSEIDVERSKTALKDSLALMHKLDPMSPEYEEQAARHRRAQIRISVAG